MIFESSSSSCQAHTPAIPLILEPQTTQNVNVALMTCISQKKLEAMGQWRDCINTQSKLSFFYCNEIMNLLNSCNYFVVVDWKENNNRRHERLTCVPFKQNPFRFCILFEGQIEYIGYSCSLTLWFKSLAIIVPVFWISWAM